MRFVRQRSGGSASSITSGIMELDLTIRLALAGDAVPVARMSRDLIEHGLGWSWTPRRVQRSIADPKTNVAVAVIRDTQVGFGIMKYHDDEAHLLLLAVQPLCAGRGIGTALVGWLEASARVAGIGQVYLEARAANFSARSFYKRLGYGEVQVVPGYYQGVESSVRMAKDLWLEQPTSA
ncbi:MAG: GNAT family N-acetyltransferase [Rhizobacter sp.]